CGSSHQRDRRPAELGGVALFPAHRVRLALEEHVDRRERRAGVDAIPQVDREARIAGPQRVAPLPVLRGVRLALRDAVHRERAGALEPQMVTRACEELEERVAIAAGAMTEVRSL